jgi:hypothetical protein
MLPICYEEGIFHGFASGTPQFMTIATEMFVKDFLSRLFSSTRTNGPHWVKTSTYKRRLQHEESLFETGEIHKNASGQLPIEQEAENNRRPLGLVDLRLAVQIEATPWGPHAPRTMRFYESAGLVDDDSNDFEADGRPTKKGAMSAPPKPLTNGVHANGVHHDDEETGWAGGTDLDRIELDSVLDDCLAGL